MEPSVSPTQKRTNEFNGYVYHLTFNKKTWNGHNTSAIDWGGHLVSIHDTRELEFIKQNFFGDSTRLIIGGMRLDGSDDTDGSQDAWEWSDGTLWDFSPWNRGQPDNAGGNDNRIFLRFDGKFFDTSETLREFGLYKKVSGILIK